MAYATKQDMIDRYGEQTMIQLTDIGPIRAEDINDTTLQRALDDASSEIESYCAGRYALPLSPVPKIVVANTCVLAKAQLQQGGHSDEFAAQLKAIRKWLEFVADGKIGLAGAAGTPTGNAGDTVQFCTGSKVFGRGSA